MPDLKPIETSWRGWRFRSRTEARWAVALTAAGKPFEYEGQGFELPSGWYLPDFWLPESGAWLEIKGKEPTEREYAVAADLAKASGHRVLIAIGSPNPDDEWLLVVDTDGATDCVEMLSLPGEAYEAARRERFDGKPNTGGNDRAASRAYWSRRNNVRGW